MSAAGAGLPSACWCCGATADGLRQRAKPVRARPLTEQAAAALVVQQKPLALAVGGLLPGHAATHSLNVLCNSCNSENGRQLAALAQQQRNNEGRHLAKQAGQLLPQGVWGKAWGRIKSALGRTAAQKRAAAEGLAAMQAAHLAGPTMGNGRYPKREREGIDSPAQEVGGGRAGGRATVGPGAGGRWWVRLVGG